MRIGILGGGQLAWLLSLASEPLGIKTLCYEPSANTTATSITASINAGFDDQNALTRFVSNVDVITYETENIPVSTIEWLSQYRPIFPSIKALSICQDRLLEKDLCQQLGIPTPKYMAINSLPELYAGLDNIGHPAVLKTRRMGYDGKGQAVIHNPEQASITWESLKDHSLILEQFIPFQREISLILVRDQLKNISFYPITENIHSEGILRLSLAPCFDTELQRQAEAIATKLATFFDYIGVLAIEFFQINNQLIVNELAPRVHNSGHWTLSGAYTSQFSNHIRAITGLPLGKTEAFGHSAMLNCIGIEPALSDVLAIPYTQYYTYHKSARANRKLAHINLNCSDHASFNASLDKLKKLINLN